ncbi:putative glutathione-dependent formaldehyde-activating enzyme protein [Cladorrhinum sp. PSN259]|nr:putative glutathione-dependent formaldehyde-activating enzyme protein [Cladorrhinum sp. PSN259]
MMQVVCQCGTISFPTPTAEPLAVYHCHCTECQKQSSSAFGTSAIFPADGLFPLSPDLKDKLGVWTRLSNQGRTMDCYFCVDCGVRIMHRIREPDGKERDTVSIKGGVVDGLNWKGAKHIYTRTAVVPIPEDVESCEGSPERMEGRNENDGEKKS